VRLHSHYARILNRRDGGIRRVYQGVDEWLSRLEDIGKRLDHD
jgi:hypothetical protein